MARYPFYGVLRHSDTLRATQRQERTVSGVPGVIWGHSDPRLDLVVADGA